MNIQVAWVRDLRSPTTPGTSLFRGVSVEITQADIDRARAELEKVSEVIFNATLTNVSGEPRYVLGSIA